MALYGVTNVSATTPTLNNVSTSVKTMLQAAAATATSCRWSTAVTVAGPTWSGSGSGHRRVVRCSSTPSRVHR